MTTADDPAGTSDANDRRSVELGPLFTTGAILVGLGVVRRRKLLVAAGLGAIWLDQRSELGRSLKERGRAFSLQVVKDDADPSASGPGSAAYESATTT